MAASVIKVPSSDIAGKAKGSLSMNEAELNNARATILDTYAALRSVEQKSFHMAEAVTAVSDDSSFLFIGIGQPAEADGAPTRALAKGTKGGFTVLHEGAVAIYALSPDGTRIAVATAIDGIDHVLLMTIDGEVVESTPAEGRVEQLKWAPGGDRLLALLAGEGTDTPTSAGAMRRGGDGEAAVTIDAGFVDGVLRRVGLLATGDWRWRFPIDPTCMIWEADWSGAAHAVVIFSDRRDEAGWYEARVGRFDLVSGVVEELYRPRDQLGHLRVSPDGYRFAFLEAVGSDRGIVCGSLMVGGGVEGIQRIETGDVEVSSVEWRDDGSLHLAGLRGMTTIVADVDLAAGSFASSLTLVDTTVGGFLPTSMPLGRTSAIATSEGYAISPRIVEVRGGRMETLLAFAANDPCNGPSEIKAECVSWHAPDGLEIQGLLIVRADATLPAPLVVDVHGGPVWAMRPCWQGRLRATPSLVAEGYAVFYPNPRGSIGRGQDFARAVLGDMGGADAYDILAGIDHLCRTGIADPTRVGVTGSSYGGYMAAWLPKLRKTITAAVPISPVSNWFSQHWTSNLPILEELFLGGPPSTHRDIYADRSPVLSPVRTTAATLTLAGRLDRSTTLGQAQELHSALLADGTISVLATYAQGGHSLRGPWDYLDSAARVLAWFRTHIPSVRPTVL